MKCMIVEDEPQAIRILENHISHFDDLTISSIHQNAMDAFSELQRTSIDILFLDIQLPKMSGIQLLHSLTNKPAVILTTAYREFALDGYELEISDYLLKPISLDRFAKAVAKIYKNKNQVLAIPQSAELTSTITTEPFLYIKSEREYIKIMLKDLLFVESLKNHIKLVTKESSFMTLMSLSQIEEKLPPQHFIRVHRSFIISIQHISRFSQSHITINEHVIPIGQLFKQKFLSSMKNNMI